MESTVISRDAWRRTPLAEIPFIAGAASAGEAIFRGAEHLLEGTVLLTGFGWAWVKTPPDESQNLVRGDAAGLCLTEYRLHVGFLHCPVAFWGARQLKELSAISRSEEMKPWDVSGRSRPISRRIVEGAGVPREWFGYGNRGVSVQLYTARCFLTPRSVEDYFSWLTENAHEWWTRRRIPPSPLLGKILDVTLRTIGDGLRLLSWIMPPRARTNLRRRIRHLVDDPVYARRYTFPWAVARTQELYVRHDRASAVVTGASGPTDDGAVRRAGHT
jgi:hypothetical protein